jgi:hypothetical protein
MAERETNQRERPPAASPRLKIVRFFLKRPNALRFAPVERGRFFTEKSPDFLHASPKRPELYSVVPELYSVGRAYFRVEDRV